MVEFFVTHASAICMSPAVRDSLQETIAPTAFTEVFETIYKRCYAGINFATSDKLTAAWWSDLGGGGAVWTELARLGLWLPNENCLISLLLQYTIVHKFGARPRVEGLQASNENFGAVLCTR